jgi:hypothetical protein
MNTTEHSNRANENPGREQFKPGHTAPYSGQYELVGPSGERTGEERTVVRGEPLPPTPLSGMRYVLCDPSNNGAGKK